MLILEYGFRFLSPSLLVSKDPNYARTTQWFEALNDRVVTSDYVVDETLTLLLMRGERSKAIEFGNLVIVGSLAILHKVTEDQSLPFRIAFRG